MTKKLEGYSKEALESLDTEKLLQDIEEQVVR
jgi:hypothetical protein